MAASGGPAMSETWLPMQQSRQLVLEGGYQKKAHKLGTKDVDSPHGQQTFVKIGKTSDWLVKAAAGKRARPGCLGRTSLVDKLKRDLIAAVAGTDKAGPSSSGHATGPDNADPMRASVALDETGAQPKHTTLYHSLVRVCDGTDPV